MISLTIKGHFIFRFNSLEDKTYILGLSPLSLEKKKIFFLPWSPGQDEMAWPSTAPVWIRLAGLPYHCWSKHILFSLASSIGQPIKLDDITTAQRILTYARVLVNIDLSKLKPPVILVDLQGERELEIEVSYENCPCSVCYQIGHSDQHCPSSNQSGKPLSGLGLSTTIPVHSVTSHPLSQIPLSNHPLLDRHTSPPTSMDALLPNSHPSSYTTPVPPFTPAPPPNLSPLTAPVSAPRPASPKPINITPSLSPSHPLPTPHSNSYNSIASSPEPPSANTPSANISKLKENSPSIIDLPYDVVFVILQKTSTLTIDTSNPFSILENCSLLEPTNNLNLYGRNLQAFSEGNSSTGPPPGFEPPGFKKPLDTSDSLTTPTEAHPTDHNHTHPAVPNTQQAKGKPPNHPKGKGKNSKLVSISGSITRRFRSKITSSNHSPC